MFFFKFKLCFYVFFLLEMDGYGMGRCERGEGRVRKKG